MRSNILTLTKDVVCVWEDLDDVGDRIERWTASAVKCVSRDMPASPLYGVIKEKGDAYIPE